MTAPTPKPTRAGELLRDAMVILADYHRYEELSAAQEAVVFLADDLRKCVVDIIVELEALLFTPNALQSTQLLADETMSDLANFMMFIVSDAKGLLEEEDVDRLRKRYGEIGKWQRALRADQDRRSFAAYVKGEDL